LPDNASSVKAIECDGARVGMPAAANGPAGFPAS
jgi:hypothetical protein